MQNKAPAHPARSISSLFANHAPAWLACIIVLVLDQLTKFFVRSSLAEGETAGILPFFSITHTSNTGAGFSILQGYNSALIWVAVFAAGLLVYFYNEFSGKDAVFMGIVLGGIAGNLIDRIVFGHVTDFLDFRVWPVFNIADAALTIGILGYIVHNLKK